jgi:hypothetical protein
MAWALHAAARGISRELIEHEILNSRDLSKKGPPLRRLPYAMRTARKAIALSANKRAFGMENPPMNAKLKMAGKAGESN